MEGDSARPKTGRTLCNEPGGCTRGCTNAAKRRGAMACRFPPRKQTPAGEFSSSAHEMGRRAVRTSVWRRWAQTGTTWWYLALTLARLSSSLFRYEPTRPRSHQGARKGGGMAGDGLEGGLRPLPVGKIVFFLGSLSWTQPGWGLVGLDTFSCALPIGCHQPVSLLDHPSCIRAARGLPAPSRN